MNNTIDKLLLFFAWLLLFVVIYCAFSPVLMHPSLILFQLSGDGGKNYFSFVHHALYDDGAWFHHMNYPYGENIMYLDGQPLLSYLALLLHKYAGLTKGGVVTILNLTPFVAFVLAVLYTYKIFRCYAITAAWALLFATLTVTMSPQTLRLCIGHYALSYVCVIPMMLYWLIQFDEKRKIRYAVYMSILSTIAVMLHPYYLALTIVLCGFYCLSVLFKKALQPKEKLYSIIIIALVLAIPAIVVKAYAAITDPVTDRPEYPYGFIAYRSLIKDFFGSQYSLLTRVFKNNWENSSEGLGYPGIAAIAVFVLSILSFLSAFVWGKRFKSPMSASWLYIAFGSVVCALAIPFCFDMEYLVAYIGPFRQFRSLGRFAWIFQFLLSIYTVVWLYHFCRERLGNNQWYVRIVMSVVAAIWCMDATGYLLFIRGNLKEASYNYREFHYWGKKDVETVLSEHNYKASDFQAILGIPFSYIGADKVSIDQDANRTFSYAIRASVNTGLPVVNALMARTSWSQAFNMSKIVGGPYAEKLVVNMMKGNKPLLLIHDRSEPLHNEDMYLIEHSICIDSLDQNILYACYPDSILKADKVHRNYAKAILSGMHGSDTIIGCSTTEVYYKRFDEQYVRAHFAGKGAFVPYERSGDTLALWKNVHVDDTTLFEFSCWFLFSKEDYRTPQVLLRFYDSAGKMLKEEVISARHSTDNHNFWFRSALFFRMPKGTETVLCRLIKPANGIRNFIALDEVLIKPHRAISISKRLNGLVLINNHILN